MTVASDGRPRRRRIVLAVLAVVLLAALFYVGAVSWRVWRLRRVAREASSLSIETLDQAGPLLDHAMAEMEALYGLGKPPLWLAGRCGWIPRVGPLLEVAPGLADDAMSLARAGHGAYHIVEPWLVETLNSTDMTSADVGWLLEIIGDHKDALDDYARDARAAADSLKAVDLADPPDGLVVAQVGARYASLGIEALAMLPELAGDGPRTYLLLALNNHELRASGGFISAIGSVTLGEGGIEIGPFEDSYKVENWGAPHPDPPEALREHMTIDLWTTRDGNWWPDFPTSARAVADLYELNQGVAVDGVIAVDLYAAEAMLEALTPLALPSGRTVQTGEVGRLFRDSWGLEPDQLRTDGVVVTATAPYVGVEVALQFPATEGQVWFDAVAIEPMSGGPGQALLNPSFEEDADSDGLPDGWLSQGLAGGDGQTPDKSMHGARSLTLIGDNETIKRVSQTLDVAGAAGTAWRISAQSASRGVPVGQKGYAMIIDFIAADGSRDRHVASFPAFTHDWATVGSDVILGDWWRHRKDVISEAMVAASAKALGQPASINWPLLALRAEQMLNEKHIQIAFFADGPANWMPGYRWDGALRQTEPDFLMVVDSNVGFNKVTASTEQTLNYSVNPDGPDGPISEVTLIYTNKSPITGEPCDKFTQYVPTYDLLTQGCYWDYVRIYVPAGAELLNTHASQQPIALHEEGSFSVFSTSLLLPPGQEAELRFTYRQRPFEGEYGLNLVKQAGTEGLDVTVGILADKDPPELLWDPPREAADETLGGSLSSSRTLPIKVDSVIRLAP